MKRNSGSKLITAETEAEKEDLWRARKVALWSALSYLPGSRAWTTDVCVPLSKFPTLIAETKADLDRLEIFAPIVGHAGDGVRFHAILNGVVGKSVRADMGDPAELPWLALVPKPRRARTSQERRAQHD